MVGKGGRGVGGKGEGDQLSPHEGDVVGTRFAVSPLEWQQPGVDARERATPWTLGRAPVLSFFHALATRSCRAKESRFLLALEGAWVGDGSQKLMSTMPRRANSRGRTWVIGGTTHSRMSRCRHRTEGPWSDSFVGNEIILPDLDWSAGATLQLLHE